jgi:hypothetical protein
MISSAEIGSSDNITRTNANKVEQLSLVANREETVLSTMIDSRITTLPLALFGGREYAYRGADRHFRPACA